MDEIGEAIEGDFFEEFARLDAEGNGEMSFASTRLAVQEQVVSVVDELALGEIGHGHRGWCLNFGEVEISECFDFGETSGLDVALDGERVPSVYLAFQKLNQEIALLAFLTLNGLDKRLPQFQPFAPCDRLTGWSCHNAPCLG